MLLAPLLAVSLVAPLTLEKQIDLAVEDGLTPGVVVVIRKGGKTVFQRARGFANLETKSKMTLDSVHEMASVSKQFTAACTMKLVQDGTLSLTDPLSKFVENAPDSWNRITVQHLLEHTGGLADYLAGDVNLGASFTAKQLLDSLAGKPLQFEPGSKWAYSNSGYMALGHVIAQASKKPFSTVLTDLVLVPSGMRTARVADPGAIIPNRAAGYHKEGKEWINETFVSKAFSELGDGMLMASANDLLAWHESLMARRVLSAKSWETMWTPSKQSSGRYGFGFGVERSGAEPRLSHSGGWVGTSTFLLSDLQSDSCIIMLINTDRPPMPALLKAATDRLAAAK